MIVNGVASHAFHSLRKSNQVDAVSNLCPNVVDIEEIVAHRQPV